MLTLVEFALPVKVVPKQADRSSLVGGRIHHYQPDRVLKNQRELGLLMLPYQPKVPFKGPLCLDLEFNYPWRRNHALKDRTPANCAKTTAPDLDNLEKQLIDVLESTGFIANDAMICEKHSAKYWSDDYLVKVRLSRWNGR